MGKKREEKKKKRIGGGRDINTLRDWGGLPFRSRLLFSNRSANAHNRTGSSPGDMSRIDIDTCYQGVSFEDAYREQ